MSNKVQFVTGLLLGLVFPALSVLVFKLLSNYIFLADKPNLSTWVGIGLNLFVLRYFVKMNKDDAVKGVILITFAFTLAVFMFKLKF